MKVLVYGFYNQGNIGDDLFVDAYRYLFPNIDFIFSEKITAAHLIGVDAVFFGGGSFLLGKPNISDDAFQKLKFKKIFYLGIGIENDIHPMHQQLMRQARLIATRSADQVWRLKTVNLNTLFVPDLVYSLRSKVSKVVKNDHSVLIMPNISVVPSSSDPHWKHAAWSYFKSEFGQFLDWLLESGYKPKLFAMCRGLNLDDNWAAAELINAMDRRSRDHFLLQKPTNIKEMTKLCSQYEIIITQRFHGIVLAEMTRTPYVAIHHHDKLKFSQPNHGKFISYYNCSKHSLIDNFNQAECMNYSTHLPIETDIFEALVNRVTSLL